MIHISRSVQPPNPNSAVPPSPSDRQPPHAARNGGGSRISAHCRSRGGGSAEIRRPMRSESDRPGPSRDTESARHARLTATKPPIRTPRKQSPPRKRRGRTHGTSPRRAPRNGTLLKTRSPKNEFFPRRAPQDGRPRKTRFSQDERSGRGFPKTSSHPEPPSR